MSETRRRRRRRQRDNGLGNNEDRISRLPEALILDVLSLLLTKDVVATSVLSNQWRVHWKMVHVLDLDDESIQSEHRTFLEDLSVLHLLWVVSSISWYVWRNLLMLMLDRSPKLQVLKLDDRSCGLESSEECLLFHLETFVWECYKEHVEEQKAVAEYILRNACRLKRATVSIQGLNSDERLDLLEELQSVVRASTSSCQLLMLDSKLSDE